MYPRNMVCFTYIIVNTLHKGDNRDDDGNDDDDDDDDDDNDNNNNLKTEIKILKTISKDINMNFGIEKRARICLKKGRVQSKPYI
jgi:hypothetical protein